MYLLTLVTINFKLFVILNFAIKPDVIILECMTHSISKKKFYVMHQISYNVFN